MYRDDRRGGRPEADLDFVDRSKSFLDWIKLLGFIYAAMAFSYLMPRRRYYRS